MVEKGSPDDPAKQVDEQGGEDPCPHLKPWRFKAGQSGNPSGRPKGRKTLLQKMQESLDEPCPESWVAEGLAFAGETVRDVLARRVVQAAAVDPLNSAGGKMLRAIMDREDPKNTKLSIESGTVASLAAAVAAIEESDADALGRLLEGTGEG